MRQRQAQCKQIVEAAFQKAEAHYNIAIPRVPVKFSNRQKTTAGTAHYHDTGTGYVVKEIRLSNTLLRLNGQTFIDRTPGHEAAHIIAVHLFQHQGIGHGRRWKEVMALIGQPASETHRMKVVHRKTKKYPYVSTSGYAIELSASRHGKIQKKGAVYRIAGHGKLNASCYAPVRFNRIN